EDAEAGGELADVVEEGAGRPTRVAGVRPAGEGGLDAAGHPDRVAAGLSRLAGPQGVLLRLQHALDPGPVGLRRAARTQRPDEPPGQMPPGFMALAHRRVTGPGSGRGR